MRRFSDRRAEYVVVVCGAQMAKTESLLCVLGHRFDDGPLTPALWVAPTERMWKTISSDRLDKMLRATPSLWEKTAKGRAYKLHEKSISGIRLGFAHAGSAPELAMHSVGLLLLDERDRMLSDVSGEGDPLALAAARVKNYPGSVIGVTSTPTVEGASPIWSLFLEGTREKWAWPCPHCEEYFVPTLELLKWPDKATTAEARSGAFVACPECGAELGDGDKPRMNAHGRFIAHGEDEHGVEHRLEEAPTNSVHSFWISGLASPWQTFGQTAEKLVGAYRSGEMERIQTAVNVDGGEVFRIRGDAPEWEQVMDRRLDYRPGAVPLGVQLITLGVDVQKDRLYWALRGWGYNAESWGLGQGELYGETAYDNVWLALGNLVRAPVGDRLITRAFIDSGYRPGKVWARPENIIYLFCRRFAGQAFPTKGHESQDLPLKMRAIDVTTGGKIVKHGVKLWHLDTDHLKTALYARIRAPADEPGAWHCHSAISEDYCRQVVSEQVIVKASGRRTWMERGPNHYLDCEVLNLAAAMSLNVYHLKPLDPEAPQPDPAPSRPRSSGFGRRSL